MSTIVAVGLVLSQSCIMELTRVKKSTSSMLSNFVKNQSLIDETRHRQVSTKVSHKSANREPLSVSFVNLNPINKHFFEWVVIIRGVQFPSTFWSAKQEDRLSYLPPFNSIRPFYVRSAESDAPRLWLDPHFMNAQFRAYQIVRLFEFGSAKLHINLSSGHACTSFRNQSRSANFHSVCPTICRQIAKQGHSIRQYRATSGERSILIRATFWNSSFEIALLVLLTIVAGFILVLILRQKLDEKIMNMWSIVSMIRFHFRRFGKCDLTLQVNEMYVNSCKQITFWIHGGRWIFNNRGRWVNMTLFHWKRRWRSSINTVKDISSRVESRWTGWCNNICQSIDPSMN
jgi:hypothetical protein